ncbi:hypothetical protein [Pantoea piersonii]|uniref:hypothetical protein n=1 Tax=Pantoea piersonii TaxID=2364647 RepID=UPI00289AC6B7|nr:hypothetical protein [Pantoea piersonii]
MGQFAIFTYLRPFMESVTGASVSALSFILLLLGAAGLAGTWAVDRLLKRHLFRWLILIPLAMATLGAQLIWQGHSLLITGALLAIWGLVSTPAPVAWGLWLSRALPESAEAGGGLMVAVIQLAITAGAALGGELFDAVGWWSPFAMGVVLLMLSALFAALANRHYLHQDAQR